MRTLLTTLLLLSALSMSAQTSTATREWDWRTDGNHIISLSPFGGVVAYGYYNPAISFDYEYIFNKEAGIGLRVPFTFGFQGPEQDVFYNNDYTHTTVYAAPGIRFHVPLGRRSAEFCTGPAIILGNMHFKPNNDYYGGTILRQPYNYRITGIMADNSINIYRRHFMFGFDARVGTLLDIHEDTRFFLHFGIHFGGKF